MKRAEKLLGKAIGLTCVITDQVLVYRDTTKGPDLRSSRIADILRFCQLSYRAGTRFNPDEITFVGISQKKKKVLAKTREKSRRQAEDDDLDVITKLVSEQPKPSEDKKGVNEVVTFQLRVTIIFTRHGICAASLIGLFIQPRLN